MTLLVPDASVVLKWVLREEAPDTPNALKLFEDFALGRVDLVLPSLWFYEVANVLSLKTSASETVRNLQFLVDQDLSVGELSWSSVRLGCEMARTLRVSFYDACYHALAIQDEAQLVTADERYYRKAGKHGSILLLRDYQARPP